MPYTNEIVVVSLNILAVSANSLGKINCWVTLTCRKEVKNFQGVAGTPRAKTHFSSSVHRCT